MKGKTLDFITQTFHGKTISRILFNWKVRELCSDVQGAVIDLAGGHTASYFRYLPQERLSITRTNIKEGEDIGLVLDLNKPLPVKDAAYDAALFFNALYILENPSRTLQEICRILKPGGKLYLSIPFMTPEIPEPHDYVRFTREGLERLFQEAGFEIVQIEKYGDRITSAAYLLHPFFVFSIVRLAANASALFLSRLAGARAKGAAPVGYFCICRRPV